MVEISIEQNERGSWYLTIVECTGGDSAHEQEIYEQLAAQEVGLTDEV